MAIQTPLTPLPPLFYWGHLSTFPQFLQEAEASAQTLLSVFQELGQQVRSGRAERGCSRGLSCPSFRAQVKDTGHTWLSPGPLKAAGPCPVLFILAFNITPSFFPVADPVSRTTHWPSLPGLDERQNPLRPFLSSHLPKESKLTSSLCSPLLWALWHISTEKNWGKYVIFFMHHIMIFFFCIKLEQFFLKWGKKAL